MPAKVKTPVDRPALVRRARWLEKRLQETDRTGRSYDEKEYKELLADFKALGVEYTSTAEQPLEEPPKIIDTAAWTPGSTLGFRKAARFMPGGSV